MGLISLNWDWIAEKAERLASYASAKGFMPGPDGYGFDIAAATVDYLSQPYDYQALQAAYGTNVWVHRCVRSVAETAAKIPIKLKRELKDGTIEDVDTHPFLDLLWNPGRFTSRHDLQMRSIGDMMLSGEFIWMVQNGTGGSSLFGAPEEIRLYKSQQIGLKLDPQEIISAYVFKTTAGQTREYAPEFFTHGKNYNPFNDFRGLPTLYVAQLPILMQYQAARYNYMWFKNSARPSGALVSKLPNLSAKAKRANIAAFKKAAGGANAHAVVHFDADTHFEAMQLNPKDAEFILSAKLTREEIAAAFGVPPIILGIFEYANYANAREQITMFFEFVIMPVLSLYVDAINNGLLRVWYDPDGAEGLFCAADYADIEALKEDMIKKATAHRILTTSGIETINEARDEIGLDGDVAWGDEDPRESLFGGLGAVSARPAPGAGVKSAKADAMDEAWRLADWKALQSEKKLEPAARRFLTGQVDRFLDAFDMASANKPNETQAPTPGTVKAISGEDLAIFLDLEVEHALIREAMIPLLRKIVRQVGQEALIDVGAGDIIFNMRDPFIAKFLAQKGLELAKVNVSTMRKATKLLVQAANEGMTVQETRDLLEEGLAGITRARALTIARTESIGANNASTLSGWLQSGKVAKKTWLSSRDDAVRDSHQALDGEEVDIDALFSNGLQFPGDQSGDPSEFIQCRCAMLSTATED